MSTDNGAASQPCCYDGELTAEPIKIGEAFTAAGVGQDVYSCPAHAHLYGAAQDRRAS